MTREHKLALIVGFSLVLVLGVLISDHFSKARSAPLAVEIKEPPAATGSMAVVPPPPQVVLPHTIPPVAPTPRPQQSQPGGNSPPAPQPRPEPSQPPSPIDLAKAHEASRPVDSGMVGLVQPDVLEMFERVEPVASLPPSSGSLKKYTVKEHDSAYAIARKHYGDGNLWTRLREFNKGKVTESGGMREGTVLDIPPKDVLQGKARLSAGPGDAPSQATVSIPDPASYTVQEGDTLSSIARRKLGSARRMNDLIDANPDLPDPDDLKVGTSIRIPAR